MSVGQRNPRHPLVVLVPTGVARVRPVRVLAAGQVAGAYLRGSGRRGENVGEGSPGSPASSQQVVVQ